MENSRKNSKLEIKTEANLCQLVMEHGWKDLAHSRCNQNLTLVTEEVDVRVVCR